MREMRRGAATVLGYVGIMGPQDGVDHLLRAVRHLVVDLGRTDVLCYVIGKGDALGELQELAADLDIEDHIVFTGWVGPEDLPRHLAAMDICIDPDPSNEYNDRCTMIKMMEYMALGKPIVAFDLPEHRVSAGEAAVYATGNDDMQMARLIAELIDDPERRARMGAIGTGARGDIAGVELPGRTARRDVRRARCQRSTRDRGCPVPRGSRR